MPIRLRLREFVPAGAWFHIARTRFAGSISRSLHDHDFVEAFWVERGRGLHVVNGQRVTLQRGDVILIRPADAHALRTTDRVGFTIVNVAFDQKVLAQTKRRCLSSEQPWPWAGDALPASFRLTPAQTNHLTAAAEQLSMARQSRLDLEWFLLTLLRMVASTHHAPAGLPVWLANAAAYIEEADVLVGGAPALADRAGKSIEHVNRVVREHLGKTTTQWITEHRLDHAARLLRMSQRSIIDIAADSGFANLGHFYKRFASRFGMTPRRYRLAGQAPT